MSRHEHDFPHEAGAAKTLARIEAGSRHLLTITRRRIAEVLDALDEGDFQKADIAMATARQTISPLAQAQSYIAIAGDSELIKVADLRNGMYVADIGTVTELTVDQCDAAKCSGHVKFKVGEHELEFGANQEVYVQHTAPDAEEDDAT